MAEAKQAQEPSMEEILASIRRIISDEDGPAEPTPEAPPEEEVSMAVGEEMNQDDLDALFDTPSASVEPEPEDEPESEPEEDFSFEASAEPELPDPVIVEGLDLTIGDVSFAEDEDEDDEPLDLGPEFEVSEPEPAAFDVSSMANSQPLADALLSPTTDAAVASAFGSLAHTILSKNARTLEDLVQDMLRPMLKSWLDDNLPVIVERLVRQEIERVTRNGGK